MKARNTCARCGLSSVIGKHETAEDCLRHLAPRYQMEMRRNRLLVAQLDRAYRSKANMRAQIEALEYRNRELEGSQSTTQRLLRLEREMAAIRTNSWSGANAVTQQMQTPATPRSNKHLEVA